VVGAFFAGVILALLLTAGSAIHSGGFWGALRSVLHGGTRFDISQPAVVQKIQQLQRLETVVYTVDKIVSGSKENPILPDFLAGDRLLLLVHGEVVAGVDFAALASGDLTIDGRHVVLHLPEAQIFSTRLDSAKTRVYSRQTGLLVPTDPDLESQVRQAAETQIHDAALADGILRTAQQNARTTLTSFLQGLGFTQVEFR
jgi:Protein of unknown function (DUF4230)